MSSILLTNEIDLSIKGEKDLYRRNDDKCLVELVFILLNWGYL